MPVVTRAPSQFSLNAPAVRRQQKMLRMVLANYLPGGALLTFLASWIAHRHGSPLALGLVALSAAQVDFYAFVISARILTASRDLRRAGSSAGQLTRSREGPFDGRRLMDKDRARGPAYDDRSGTVVFFANLGDLYARRRRHLHSFWRIPLATAPAAAGLFVAGQPLAAGLVLAVTATLVLRHYGQLAELAKPLRLDRKGHGRMELSPECLTMAGTDVAIPWSHIRRAALSRSGPTGLDGVIQCPEPEPDESCRYRGRTIKFHIDDSLFSTTVDDFGAAFGRYIEVADGT